MNPAGARNVRVPSAWVGWYTVEEDKSAEVVSADGGGLEEDVCVEDLPGKEEVVIERCHAALGHAYSSLSENII